MTLEDKLKRLEANKALEEGERKRLQELYQQVLKMLAAADEHAQSAKDFRQAKSEAPRAARKIWEELEKRSWPQLDLGKLERKPMDELEQMLEVEKQLLALKDSDVAELEQQLARQVARPDLIKGNWHNSKKSMKS